MGINLTNPKNMFNDIRKHIGHEIQCVRYSEDNECVNVAIECVTCGSILISQFDPERPATATEIAADKNWEDAYGAASDAMAARIEAALEGDNAVVVYSACESENGIPQDNLDEVPVQGTVKFIYEDSWGEGKYRSPVMESPTWLQIAVLANQAIKLSGDMHHVFLEGVDFERTDKAEGGQKVAVYNLGFGS